MLRGQSINRKAGTVIMNISEIAIMNVGVRRYRLVAIWSLQSLWLLQKKVSQSSQSYRNHSSAIVVKCCDRFDCWSVVSIWLQRLLNGMDVFSANTAIVSSLKALAKRSRKSTQVRKCELANTDLRNGLARRRKFIASSKKTISVQPCTCAPTKENNTEASLHRLALGSQTVKNLR